MFARKQKNSKLIRGGALFLTVTSLVMPLAACSGGSGNGAVATPPLRSTREGQESTGMWDIPTDTDPDSTTEDSKKLHEYDLYVSAGASDILNAYYVYDDPTHYYSAWPTTGLMPVTSDAFDTAVTSYQSVIDYLATLDPANLSESENRLLKDMLFDFEHKRDYYKLNKFIPALTPSSGTQITYPLCMSLIQFRSKEDADRYLKILEDFYDFFSAAVDLEEARSKMGIGWTDENLDSIIEDCRKMADGRDVHFMRTTFESRIGALKLSSTETKAYIEKNKMLLEEKYFPAYEMMIERLTKLKGTNVSSKYLASTKEGKEYYQVLFQMKTGTEMTPDEGIKFLQKAIDEIYEKYNPIWKSKGSMYSFGSLNFDTARDWCERFTNEHFPGIKPNTVAIYDVPKEFSESMPPAMYYLSPIDNYTKHQVWVNNGVVANPRYNMYTIVSHEMYPGHLYQHQYQAEVLDNRYQVFSASTPYAEGWAQYAEWLMIHFAPFDQEAAESAWMAEMLYSALISARLSLGVDYEGWDYDRCLTYLEKYGQDEKVLDDYWKRITGSQGYALEYAFGYIYTSEILNNAIEKLDGKVTQDEVVKAYLDLGCAPFDVLAEDMENYIKEKS